MSSSQPSEYLEISYQALPQEIDFNLDVIKVNTATIDNNVSLANASINNGDKEKAIDFQNRTLLIVLKDEKKEENVRLNSYLKKAFDSEWDIHDSIMFVTKKEYKKFRKDDSKAFFIHQRTATDMMITTKSTFDLGNCGVNVPVVKYGFDFEDETTLGDVYRQIQKIKHQVLSYINLDPKHAIPTRQVRKTQGRGIDQRDAGETIKNMTLYIDQEIIDDDFKANLDKLYNYDYKLVTNSEIKKAIIDNNDKQVMTSSELRKKLNLKPGYGDYGIMGSMDLNTAPLT